jgi:hypothetical protein
MIIRQNRPRYYPLWGIKAALGQDIGQIVRFKISDAQAGLVRLETVILRQSGPVS